MLISSSSLHNEFNRSMCKFNDSNAVKGMHTKLTFTSSIVNAVAPIVITVCSLSERHMPKKNIIMLKIKRLCIGNGSVTIGNIQEKILCFIYGINEINKKMC